MLILLLIILLTFREPDDILSHLRRHERRVVENRSQRRPHFTAAGDESLVPSDLPTVDLAPPTGFVPSVPFLEFRLFTTVGAPDSAESA